MAHHGLLWDGDHGNWMPHAVTSHYWKRLHHQRNLSKHRLAKTRKHHPLNQNHIQNPNQNHHRSMQQPNLLPKNHRNLNQVQFFSIIFLTKKSSEYRQYDIHLFVMSSKLSRKKSIEYLYLFQSPHHQKKNQVISNFDCYQWNLRINWVENGKKIFASIYKRKFQFGTLKFLKIEYYSHW